MSGPERELLLEAFDSNWIAPLGPFVDRFERETCARIGSRAAAALSSGTAALHLALLALGVEKGDSVICSSFTFAASAYAISYIGAEPVFIDSDTESWNIDPDLLEEELHDCAIRGKLPKAAIIVDLYGQCADFDRILAICASYEIPVIEDAAEALGARYRDRNAGTLGTLSVLSFNGNKIITTSGGGMLLSDDETAIARVKKMSTQARDDAPHYQHSAVGYNYRMSNLLAAVGVGQLQSIDDRVERRRANFARYERMLGDMPGIRFMPEPSWSRSNRWLTCLTIDPLAFGASREEVRVALESENIESRPLWKPMHLQPVYQDCRMRGGRVSALLFERGLCLPSGSAMAEEDFERVERAIHRVPAVRAHK